MLDQLRLLCFGDSITAGWSQWGAEMHPYAPTMKSTIEKAFRATKISAVVRGLPGDQVRSPPGRFLSRITSAFKDENNTPAYDWAIILGGTNDLSMWTDSDDICSALQSVWSIPLSHSTKVLAMTVPECGSCNVELDDRRDEVNQMIIDHEADNYYVFDLHSAIPYWQMPKEQREEIWADGVHFSAKGYDLMGKLVGERLVELINGLEAATTNGESNSLNTELKR